MQTTIAKMVELKGVGLHSGKDFIVQISEASANTGIQFRRSDIMNCPYTRITPYNVSSTQLATTVNCGDLPISTIEHLMASLFGLGVDNAYVDVFGAEVPIMDGSAAQIIKLLLDAGVKQLVAPKKILKILRPIQYCLDDKIVEILPSDSGLTIDFLLDYNDSCVGKQRYHYTHNNAHFISEIAFARTFGFKREIDALWSMGLARGGSFDNAIVIGEDKVLNPGGLRAKDEFVRHKILDMLGDLSLIGYSLQGDIRAVKAGHNINNLFARAVLEADNSYEVIDEQVKIIQKIPSHSPIGLVDSILTA